MKRFLEIRPAARCLFGFALAATLALPLPSLAATVALATEPLTTTTASNVKPNVMFILDDSGTMEYNYLPDWANDNHPVTGVSYSNMPEIFTNSGFNGVAYNPAVTYTPPVFYTATGALDTTTYPSYNNTGTAVWTTVKRDGYGIISTSTDNLVGNASYYTFVDGEYCSTIKKTSCVVSATPTTVLGITYNTPAGLRWCDSAALTNCQSINNSTFLYPRYPGAVVQAHATITVTGGGSATGLVVNGKQILSAATSSSGTTSTVASRVVSAINACTAATTGNCTIAGYSASRSGSTITIIAPAALGAITYSPVLSGVTNTPTAFTGGLVVPGSNVHTTVVSTTPNYPYAGTTSAAPTRTDCTVGTPCTYAQEMTNYSNWWAYYHTRSQAMKSSVSRAFKSLNANYRVGFSTICDTSATTGTLFLAVDTFELAQKNNWFKKLFSAGTGCYTPLRGALSKTGRYYAHKVGSVDPVQYSCQQNFAIISTDGYWNTNAETSTFGPIGLTGANVGDLDKDPATRITGMYQGPTATSNTLADVAKYYYENDLRTSTLGNCAGAKSPDFTSGNPDVCTNNVFTSATDNNTAQHMTTFTMGLGADGVLNFQTDYDSANSGDFYDLKHALGSPTTNWPVPVANSATAIDDLWHAAVNGRGEYFSAKDPDSIINGFNKALSSITAKIGSAAAAATSTLNPVAGNNFVYLASYTTVKWTGNLEARSIDINTGLVSDTASWCAENIIQNTCTSPSTIVPVTSGSSTVYNCVTPSVASSAACPSPGVYDSTAQTCTTQIDNGCTGSLPPRVAAVPDTRTIYTAPAGGMTPISGQNLVSFNTAYATANPANFNPSTASPAGPVDGLTQWATIATAHTPAKLINFLRGQSVNEIRAANAPADQLYRARDTVMGDTLESQPAFVADPIFPYTYPGYAEFKAAQASRFGTVYVGSNDGMLHAFVGADYPNGAPVSPEIGGRERWAYVPSMAIPKMWKLADTGYSTKHTNFINGSPNIADVCVSGCTDAGTAVWKTILVGGLNAGGRGYYALDITLPETPKLLWEFTTTAGIGTTKDDDLGYSYGRPIIARKVDGTWVVVVTSGYNNVSPGSGLGYLYVLDANSGSIISKITTGAGSTTTPNGLAQVSIWNDAEGGNQAGYAYATDLQGNIWRFDINTASPATGTGVIGNGTVMKFATLLDNSGVAQPITTVPVLGLVNSYHVIFVGTGKYLEASDLTSTQLQSFYAIKDVGASATWLNNPRSYVAPATAPNMIQQTITTAGSVRTGSKNAVDFSTDLGWFIDFPDSSTGSERVNINPKLVLGTLLVPTIVPSSTVCSPGGYGWLNYFDYTNGWPIDGGVGNTNVSLKYDSPIVGYNIIYIGGNPKLMVVTADGDIGLPKGGSGSGAAGEGFFDLSKRGSTKFESHRVIWRELIP